MIRGCIDTLTRIVSPAFDRAHSLRDVACDTLKLRREGIEAVSDFLNPSIDVRVDGRNFLSSISDSSVDCVYFCRDVLFCLVNVRKDGVDPIPNFQRERPDDHS